MFQLLLSSPSSLAIPPLVACLFGALSAASPASIPLLPLSPRDPRQSGGVKLHSSCDPNTYAGAKAQMAIEDTSRLVTASLFAVGYPDQPPFNYFFNPSDAPAVEAVFNAIAGALDEGEGPITWVWCKDYTAGHENICEGRNNAGVAATNIPGPGRIDTSILMCPKALALSKSPDPCKYPYGTYSIGVIMLEALLLVYPLVQKRFDNGPFTPKTCHALLNGKGNPANNLDSYQLLALWSYRLGLGEPSPVVSNCVEQMGASFPEEAYAVLDDANAANLDKATWGVMARRQGLDYFGLVDGSWDGPFAPIINRPS
ncbi:MAG: hypothetical protein M1812_006216 [Candelaria pacifica]|nr:MAG: hypothetical protein M1812_006216 [Candelaria pacifica]